jgi:hypothetical protein
MLGFEFVVDASDLGDVGDNVLEVQFQSEPEVET